MTTRFLRPALFALTALLAVSCGDTPGDDFDRSAMLRSIGETVILPTYRDFAAGARALVAASVAFCASPSAETLDATQQAFWDAKGFLKEAEASAYGPHTDNPLRLGPRVDFWPARTDSVDALLAAEDAVDAEALASRGAGEVGLPAIGAGLRSEQSDGARRLGAGPRPRRGRRRLARPLPGRLRRAHGRQRRALRGHGLGGRPLRRADPRLSLLGLRVGAPAAGGRDPRALRPRRRGRPGHRPRRLLPAQLRGLLPRLHLHRADRPDDLPQPLLPGERARGAHLLHAAPSGGERRRLAPASPHRRGEAALRAPALVGRPRTAPALPPPPGRPRRPLRPRQLFARVVLGVHFALQLLLPLRQHLYPGERTWHEQGFRFAWNVMLVEKTAMVDFRVVDAAGGETVVHPREILTPLQRRMMTTQPDMILSFAHHLRDRWAAEGRGEVEVHVDAWCALNGRRRQRFIDPEVDMARVEASLAPRDWVLPLAPRDGR